MNIVYINKSWTNKIPDGIATYTRTIADMMVRRGHKVHIITLYPVDSPSKNRKYIFHFVRTYLPTSMLRLKIFQIFQLIFFQIGVYWQYRKLENEIDLIEAPDAAAEGFFVALLRRKKLVTRLHTPLIFCSKFSAESPGVGRKILGLMEYYQTSRSQKISSPSKVLSAEISKAWDLKSKITVIPNPLSSAIKTSGIYPRTNFLFVSGFDAEEGLSRFQTAFANLQKIFPIVNASAVGKFRLAKGRRKKSKIIYLGLIDQTELFGRIKSADAVVFSARWENFPYALLEARLLKKIAICPKVGGYQEIVKNGFDGFLYNIDVSNDLFLKMKHCFSLSRADQNKIGQRAYKKTQQYSSPVLVTRYENYYQSLTKYLSQNEK